MARVGDLELRIDDAELRRWIAAGLKEAQLGGAAAINKTVQHVWSRTARGVAKSARVPLSAVRKRCFRTKARPMRLSGRFRAYTMALNPAHYGAKQTGTRAKRGGGVSWRQHSWPSAFLEKPKGGKRLLVMKRVGKEPYPLKIEKVHIDPLARTIASKVVARAAQVFFSRTLPHEVWWRLEKAGRR